jgi:hypothetical protein
MNANEGNEKLKQMVLSGEAFCAGKIGNSEQLALVQNLMEAPIWNQQVIYFITVIAGVFPNDQDTLNEFAEVFYDCLDEVDLSAKWLEHDEEILKTRNPDVALTELRGLEPYYHDNPWTESLAGKKVLVMSPFAKTIKDQYDNKRELLWEDDRILPEFDLEVVETPQSFYLLDEPVYENWFDGLDDLKSKIEESDADVVITGCGAWSLPLAAHAKKFNKQGIHMGGPTQILFGVKGGRWDKHPVISEFYNEHWTRPSEEETPEKEKTELVENSCYW